MTFRHLVLPAVSFLAVALSGARAESIQMDSGRGQRVFESEGCSQCHSINGKGGKTAPDLGRALDRNFTPAALASTMWNHAPTMWAAMDRSKVKRSSLDEQAASDLFAYFYSARFFEKPGDAGRGKRLFHDKTCDRCHGLTTSPLASAPPVSKWQTLTDPIAMTQAMWNHSGAMLAEIQQKKMSWPQLTTQDLSDLLVYFRNLPNRQEKQTVFITTSGNRGQELFAAKGCKNCHDASTLLLRTSLDGRTLTGVAAALWDHAPRMKTPPARFEGDEMRELLSYLWANQFFQVSGNADRGRRLFTAKRCSVCHDDPKSGAPDLSKRQEAANGATMVSVLWRHGPQMLEQMKAKGIKWPRFETFQMSDVIAYLNSRKK
jgi:mono/diheme cytochrome c family protein